MQLTAEQLGQILRTLVSPSLAGHAGDKRRAPRITVPFEASILLLSDGDNAKPRTVQVRDVSLRGLSFTYPLALEKGQQFILRLPGADGQITRILGVVVHVRTAGLLFRMGAEMVCRMHEEAATPRSADAAELGRIRQSMLAGDAENAQTAQEPPIDSPSQPSDGAPTGPDKRRAPRSPQIGQITIVPFEGGSVGPARSARLEDLSCRGLCIVHNQAFGPGQQFVVRLANGTDGVANILCSAVHCEPLPGGRFRIGAEFLENLAGGALVEEPRSDSNPLVNHIRDSILAEETAA